MGIYDPPGLALPVRMKGAILFRKVWQLTKKQDCKEENTKAKKVSSVDWDEYVGDDLKAECLVFFVEMTRLSELKFPRSLTPINKQGEFPDLVTFNDGSDSAYGACLYARWRIENSIEGEVRYDVRLVESKGKLCPLDLKGDTVKSEMNGAVFAVRLRKYVTLHLKMKFGRVFHFLDSMTVMGALRKDSYGFQTYFANRVGEVQDHSSPDEWRWVPTEDNPSDLITRGASPDSLKPGSFWQSGPSWLKLSEENWPKTKDVTKEIEDKLVSLQRKAFTNLNFIGPVAGISSSGIAMNHAHLIERMLMIEALEKQLDIPRFSRFDFFITVVATVMTHTHDLLKVLATSKAAHISQVEGRPVSAAATGLLLHQLRRRLSISIINAQSSCLLSRLGHMSPGAREAAQRRAVAKHRAESIAQDLRSHFEAHVRGRRLRNIGVLHI